MVLLVFDSYGQLSKYIIAIVALLSIAYKLYVRLSFLINRSYFYSLILSYFGTPPSTDYRGVFRTCHLEQSSTISDAHSHGESANSRASANTLMNTFVDMIGFKPYSLSMSHGEAGHMDGQRLYYTAKDLQSEVINDRITPLHVIRLTDVDYYVDMAKYLSGLNVIIYTLVPNFLAGLITNGVISVNPDNTITNNIHGGGSYTHKLWDYETDHLMVDHWWGTSLYLLEQRKITDDRRVIFFNFIRNIYGPFAWFLPGRRLRYRQMVYGDVAYLRRQELQTLGHHHYTAVEHVFALLGAISSVVISDRSLQTSLIRTRCAKEPQISDIERILRSNDEPNPAYAASVLFYLIKSNNKLLNVMNNFTSQAISPDMYQTTIPLVTEDAKPSCRTIAPPILDEGFHPGRSYNNDHACIDGRIKQVKNKTTKYPPFYWVCLNEFIDFFIPQPHALSPKDFDYQYQQFNRPSQRGIVNACKHVFFLGKFFIKAFQKAEIYSKISDPRNISTLPVDHNFRLGQYSYSLSEAYLKTSHWYAFAQHPQELTKRVLEVCTDQDYVVPTDVSRCDGSMGYIHYCLMQAVVMRAFAPQYHAEILTLLKKEAYAKGFTTHDLQYTALYNTLSGSSSTSWRNSVANAFMNYIALRHDFAPFDSYQKLGIYGGDDGISRCVNPAILERVFAKCGMLLKAEVVAKGSPLTFLGRIFLDPSTTPESIIDVRRHLVKLHLTTAPEIVPVSLVYQRRAEGYAITDPNTPLISNWAKYIMRVYPATAQHLIVKYSHYLLRDVTYWSRFDAPFPPLKNLELAYSVIAKSIGVDVADVVRLSDRLDACDSTEDYAKLSHYFTANRKIEITAAVRGEMVDPNVPIVPHQDKIAKVIKSTKIKDAPLAPTSLAKKLPPPVKPRTKFLTKDVITNNQASPSTSKTNAPQRRTRSKTSKPPHLRNRAKSSLQISQQVTTAIDSKQSPHLDHKKNQDLGGVNPKESTVPARNRPSRYKFKSPPQVTTPEQIATIANDPVIGNIAPTTSGVKYCYYTRAQCTRRNCKYVHKS